MNWTEGLAALSVRDGLGDDRFFVGRAELLDHLAGCYTGQQRTCAWLYGPRRIGKTSVAKEVARRAERTGTKVLFVDAMDVRPASLEALIRRVIGSNGAGHQSGDERAKFEGLVRSHVDQGRPFLLIVDEADGVVMNFQTNEQAFLRRLKADVSGLAYLFVSHMPPAELVEEVPEKQSRLLGVCEQRRVMPLERRDIKELATRVASTLEIQLPQESADFVWNQAGGFPLAVTGLLKAIAIARKHATGDVDLDVLPERLAGELRVDLRDYWRSLNPGSRTASLDPSTGFKHQADLKEDGLWSNGSSTLGTMVKSLGERSGNADEDRPAAAAVPVNEIAFTLRPLVREINEALQLTGRPNGFRLVSAADDVFRAARTPCTDDQLKLSLDYLYQVYFEGARSTDGNPRRYLLPPPLGELYAKSEVIQTISDLRCFYFHDHARATDHERPNRYAEEAGAHFERLCGRRVPATDELRLQVRTRILQELHSLLVTVRSRVCSAGTGGANE